MVGFFRHYPNPEKPIQIHCLGKHSYTALVTIPLVTYAQRVHGTTAQQTKRRAKWLIANYWRLRLQSEPSNGR